jgi:hypothetical protein
MPDTQVKNETAASSIEATDRFYIVKDPTGSPLDRYGTPAQMLAYVKTGMVTSICATIDGGGSALTAGKKGQISVPFGCTITGWTAVADASGSVTVQLNRSTYSGFPTTSAISSSPHIALSSVQKNTDSTLTGWTTSIAAGDVLEFEVTGTPATITRLQITLGVTRT